MPADVRPRACIRPETRGTVEAPLVYKHPGDAYVPRAGAGQRTSGTFCTVDAGWLLADAVERAPGCVAGGCGPPVAGRTAGRRGPWLRANRRSLRLRLEPLRDQATDLRAGVLLQKMTRAGDHVIDLAAECGGKAPASFER